MLQGAGADKINFVGGEPTLAPYLGELLEASRAVGLVTSIVTNGERLDTLLDTHHQFIDWVGLSVDSAIEQVEVELGRGRGGHVARSRRLFARLSTLRIGTKLNTTVTSLNCEEDMSGFVLDARPLRWKVFQVLPVEGQNTGRVEPLLITTDQFMAFVRRHEWLGEHGIHMAVESNDDMTGSYAMIDPLGRFFSNSSGRHVYSRPILDVGWPQRSRTSSSAPSGSRAAEVSTAGGQFPSGFPPPRTPDRGDRPGMGRCSPSWLTWDGAAAFSRPRVGSPSGTLSAECGFLARCRDLTRPPRLREFPQCPGASPGSGAWPPPPP